MKLEDVVDTISQKHKFDIDNIILVNTSDVLEGKVLNHKYVPNKNLRGQFKKSFQKDDILYSEIRPQNKRFAYIDFDSKDYVASTKLMVLRKRNNN
ncbi:MAG: restriction endonuclease subunit S, partial [Actinobacteria bacterium]|nr:restriction endonuclease subunit S [Actinomycetota bacterium]